MPPATASVGHIQQLESPHPYPDNCDRSYWLHLPGARAMEIVFDERSATEATHDYVQFFEDTSSAARYGAEKYSGGRAGSGKTWPGVAGVPPLIIPSDKCVVKFHSDGSLNDWGWKLTARACEVIR